MSRGKANPFAITLPQGPVPVEQFLAVGPFCWGTGKTMKDALANCRRFGSKVTAEMCAVYALSKAGVAEVTDTGSVSWPAGVVVMRVQEAQL